MALALLSVIAFFYLLQVFSPLRLNTDSTFYLSLAAAHNDGREYLYQGRPLALPTGYSTMLALLEKAGLGSSSFFVALNLVFLAVGVMSFAEIWRTHFQLTSRTGLYCAALFLLSYVVVKHVTLPTSDTVFLGLSGLCLAILGRYKGVSKQGWLWCLLAVLPAAVAIFVRTIGVALIPAILFALFTSNEAAIITAKLRGKRPLGLLALAGGLAGLLILFWLIAKTKYFHIGYGFFLKGDLAHRIVTPLKYRMLELGSLTLNLPESKVPGAMTFVLGLVGFAAFCGVVFSLWQRRNALGTADVYFLGYLVILSLWPFPDVRFWMPIVPLLIGYVLSILQPISQMDSLKLLGKGYATAFFLIGAVALGLSTRISLAGDKFPDLYGTGSRRETYRQAFGLPVENPGAVEPNELSLLRRYGSAK